MLPNPLDRLRQALAERYTIERELGRGASATVYLAQDQKHNRKVALKVLAPELALAVGAERFLLEIQIAAQLQHPHILTLHDSGEVDGWLYYVMPYVEGESLGDRLERTGPLSLEEALKITREVALALEYAHAQGVIHRDIKPANILLSGGEAVVADFGIARAIEFEAVQPTTETGIAVGTPAYMSPEQVTGAQLDGRTDIYSLACVLYEMLAGDPPFMGPTAQAVFAGIRTDPPPRVRAVRRDVPAAVELAILKALTKAPADRFATAAQFAEALAAGLRSPTSVFALPVRAWAALVPVAVAAGLAVATVPRWLAGRGLDHSLYVIVPFEHGGGAAPALLNGDQCESLLYDAFGRWEDVRVVNDLRVRDVRLRRGDGPATLRDALALARGLGAGRLAWGEVGEFPDAFTVRATLYDVARGGAVLQEHAVRIARDLSDKDTKFRELADSLLLGRVHSAAAPGAAGTRSIAAWQAYEAGHAALWDLEGARHAFQAALELDPAYPHAHLWLAQVMAIAGDSATEWRPFAFGAAVGRDRLSPVDAAFAEALLALANGRYAQACEQYESQVARDSLSFQAWYGLGECRARDQLVVRDLASPSGWRFRSSYHAAADAYQRALQLLPSIHVAFRGRGAVRLTRLLFARGDRVREGFALGADTAWFGAFASLDRDTLAFVPYPLADVFAARPEAIPRTASAAVARNREVLRGILTAWLRGFPTSADLHETLGLVLEALGNVEETDQPDRSALAAVRGARRLARDSEQSLRLAAAEARLLLKLGHFSATRNLADSLLDEWPHPRPAEVRYLAGLAALTGRAHRTAELLAGGVADSMVQVGGRFLPVPHVATLRTWHALRGYAALGAPAESLTALARRVDSLVQIWVEPARRQAMRDALLDNPRVWAFPRLGTRPVPPFRAGLHVLEMQSALERHDTAAIRRAFARIRDIRSQLRPGDVAIWTVYQEARVLLGIGDTAAATQLLDQSLDALPAQATHLLPYPVHHPAALVRAMALRAELADRAGDRPRAQRWGEAVHVLWGDADVPELRAIVDTMRTLAGKRPR